MAGGSSDFTVTSCRCGHGPHAHEHYRRGKDCSLCACTKFRSSEGSLLSRLTGRRARRDDNQPTSQPTSQPTPVDEPQHAPEQQPAQQRHSIAS